MRKAQPSVLPIDLSSKEPRINQKKLASHHNRQYRFEDINKRSRVQNACRNCHKQRVPSLQKRYADAKSRSERSEKQEFPPGIICALREA